MAKKTAGDGAAEKEVDPELTARATAKAVCDGDFVNFQFLFSPFSPARKDSPERFESEKFDHLLPDGDCQVAPAFRAALEVVRSEAVWGHIEQELEANRPARLPWELLLMLADNAVRLGKYASAAQAYELLRIRRRMQAVFFEQADAALEQGAVKKAVRGYLIATGLEYDYAGFPEPLPDVPDFQTRALMLHGEYPKTPEDCVALQEPAAFLRTALGYLLLDAGAAARIAERPVDTQVAFLKELVHQRDPEWREFVHRFREACDMMRDLGKRLTRSTKEDGDGATLAEEIEEQLGEDPRQVPALLTGRTVEGGEWWQYMKELAYEHPAAVLFVSRQLVGEVETLVPRYRADSPVPRELGLVTGAAGVHP
ncbi:MAG: hypothetical protein JXR94_24855 [Candidatus Hydrogenedentes bacterium]|nr:hypothetical protein [Candidatus Hydrogenedentota bacterium]